MNVEDFMMKSNLRVIEGLDSSMEKKKLFWMWIKQNKLSFKEFSKIMDKVDFS
jgi:hypothetical protein